MKLLPYQREGAEWLASRKTALLADEMGLGKTVQIIAAAKAVQADPIMVICPAHLQTHWRRHFDELWPEANVTILPWDQTWREKGLALMYEVWGLLILDESHYAKSPTAKRTIAVYGDRQNLVSHRILAGRIWAISGTPAPNTVDELWTTLWAIYPEAITVDGKVLTHEQFVERYCTWYMASFGRKITGAKNIPELKERIAPFVLRRKAADVLKDLPDISYSKVVLERDAASFELDELERDLGVAGDYDSKAILAAMNRESNKEEVSWSRLRRLCGELKVGPVARLLQAELQEGQLDKVVVWAWHKDVIAQLTERLARFGAVQAHGSTGHKNIAATVDQFQHDPDCRVFIGQIVAAGTGLTLTAANQCVFAEHSYVPAQNQQAAKRIHRIGQTRPCFARIIALADSVDEKIVAAIERKMKDLRDLY